MRVNRLTLNQAVLLFSVNIVMIFHLLCWFSCRYGKGFGIVRNIFGEDSVLNQPNSLGGMLFYCILIALSKYEYHN
jgi:hypothetical protein